MTTSLSERFKNHWKFNSTFALMIVFITDGLYLIAYFVVQPFLLSKGYGIEFMDFSAEKSRMTLLILTLVVFLQAFILSWVGNFYRRFKNYGSQEKKIKDIDWDDI